MEELWNKLAFSSSFLHFLFRFSELSVSAIIARYSEEPSKRVLAYTRIGRSITASRFVDFVEEISLNLSSVCEQKERKKKKMQQLLFSVIFSEMAVIMVLSFKTPFRKLVIMSLDRVKRGRGPVMVKTVAGTVSVVLASSIYSMMKIKKRWIDEGAMNPTDQVLMAKHLLESTLMGNLSFLLLHFEFCLFPISTLNFRNGAFFLSLFIGNVDWNYFDLMGWKVVCVWMGVCMVWILKSAMCRLMCLRN